MRAERTSSLSRRHLALLVLALLSLLGLLLSLGKYVSMPPAFSVATSKVSEAVQSDECGAVVDTSGERAIITDGQGRVTTVLGGNLLTSKASSFGCVATCGDSVYLEVIEYGSNSDLIEHDKIIRYSSDGEAQETVLDFSYDTKVNPKTETSIVGIDIVDGHGLAIVAGNDFGSVYTTSFPLTTNNGGETYDAATAGTAVGSTAGNDGPFTRLGTLPDGGDAFDADLDPTTGDIYILTTLGNTYRQSDTAEAFEPVEADGRAAEGSSIVASDSESVTIMPQLDQEGETILFTPALAARQAWFWAGLAVLATMLLVVCARSVMRAVQRHEYHRLKMVAYAICVFVAACAIVSTYATEMSKQAAQDREVSLKTAVILAYEGNEGVYQSAVDEYSQTGGISSDAYQSTAGSMQRTSEALGKNECSALFNLFAINEKGAFILSDSTRSMIASTETNGVTAILPDINGSEEDIVTGTHDNVWGSYSYAARIMRNDAGEVTGALVATSDANLFTANMYAKQVALLAGLLAAAIAAAFLISELQMWGKAGRKYQRMRRHAESYPEVALARPMYFLACAGDGVAMSLAVLIALDMLQGTPQAGDALLLSLPLALNAIGLLAGGILYSALSRHLSQRKVLTITQSLACASYASMATSVALGNFYSFMAFMFTASLFGQSAVVYASSLPLNWPDETARSDANESMATASISLSTLSTLAAGGISMLLGNAFVFVLAAIFPFLVLVLILATAPKRARSQHDEVAKIPLKNLLQRMMNPQLIVLIICLIGVISIATGYKNYLFPLMLADNGFTKTDFANVLVICNAIAFFTSPIVSRAGLRLGHRKLAIISLCMLAATFFGFMLNNTLIWGTVALALILICDKVGTPCWKTLWPRSVTDSSVPKRDGYVMLDSVDKGFDAAKAPIWAALAQVGQLTACAIFALLSAVAAIFFAVATRNGPFRDDKVPGERKL